MKLEAKCCSCGDWHAASHSPTSVHAAGKYLGKAMVYAPWARGQLPQKTWVVQLVQLQRQFDCWILQGISEGNLCRATLVGGEGGQAAAHGLHHSQPKRLIQRRLHKRPVLVCTAQRTLSCAPHSAAAHTPWDGPCSAPQHTPFGRGFLWGTVLLCQMPVKLTLQQCALLASLPIVCLPRNTQVHWSGGLVQVQGPVRAPIGCREPGKRPQGVRHRSTKFAHLQ